MRSILRIVHMPNRLDSVPKPVALRYLDKDAQGHIRIRARTPSLEQGDKHRPTLLADLVASKKQG